MQDNDFILIKPIDPPSPDFISEKYIRASSIDSIHLFESGHGYVVEVHIKDSSFTRKFWRLWDARKFINELMGEDC